VNPLSEKTELGPILLITPFLMKMQEKKRGDRD
jgi:hypothetical protein